MQADLHGRKLSNAVKPLNVSSKKRKEFNKDALQLFDRLKERHKDYGSRSRTTD